MSEFLRRQNSRHRRHLSPGYFPTDRAGSHRHLRIVANALHLAHVAAGHHVELVGFFSKPNWRIDLCAILTERAQREVSLAANRRGDRSHAAIVTNSSQGRVGGRVVAGTGGSREARTIDPTLSSVLKA